MEHLEPTQFDKLFDVGGKDLVMFYADWCPFCQRFKPLFESVAAKSSSTNSYKMYGAKVNDDDNPLWDRFSINAVPAIIAFDKESDLASILKEIGT
jgi:thioredoxin 1